MYFNVYFLNYINLNSNDLGIAKMCMEESCSACSFRLLKCHLQRLSSHLKWHFTRSKRLLLELDFWQHLFYKQRYHHAVYCWMHLEFIGKKQNIISTLANVMVKNQNKSPKCKCENMCFWFL